MTDTGSDRLNERDALTPIEALNRTIEALESRLDGLLAQRGRTRRPAPAAAMPPGGEEAPQAPLADRRDAIEQIRARQRRLDAFRARTAALRSGAAETTSSPREETAAPALPVQPAAGAREQDPESDLREVAQALVALRRELRGELGEEMNRHFRDLRADLKTVAAGRDAMPERLREALSNIDSRLHGLSTTSSDAALTALKMDLTALGQSLNGLAREETLRSLDNHWAEICGMMADVDPASMRDELVALTSRLDDIAAAVSLLPEADRSRQIEDQLHALTDAVERLAQSGAHDTGLGSELAALDDRLNEISAAIVAVGTTAGQGIERGMLDRLEARLADIGERLGDNDAILAELAPRLDGLASRIEGLSGGAATAEMAERLAVLTDHVAKLSQSLSGEGVEEIGRYLDELAGRIDALDATMRGSAAGEPAWLGRFETLVERFDARTDAAEPSSGLEALQRQLEIITSRLDEGTARGPASEEAVRGLEAQIATLASLMNGETGEAGTFASLGVLEPRLAAIEDRLGRNQEDVITAASRAAEAAVTAFLERGAEEFEEGGDELALVSGLADDLRALEKLTRMSEERHARAFDAVHDTLLKIAERLESLDRNRSGWTESGSETMAPAMVAVGAEAEAYADADLVAEAPATGFGSGGTAEIGGDRQPGSRSLLGRLADRVKPKTQAAVPAQTPQEPVFAEDREEVEPTPPLDPSDTLDESGADEPLEPGSGTPDISRILQKVREQQSAGVASGQTRITEAERSDFIAAARRAAQAAAAEVESSGRKSGSKAKKASNAGEGSSRRRPILIAVGAVLLAVMSYPLISNLTADPAPSITAEAVNEASEQAAETAALAPEAAPGDAAPAGNDVPANGTEQAAPAAPEPDTAQQAPVQAADEAEDPTAGTEMQATAEPPAAQSTVAPMATSSLTPEAEPAAPAADAGEEASIEEAPAVSGDVLVARVDALPEAIGPAPLKAAARDGDPVALFEIGARYTEGEGVEPDLAAAAEWYAMAAERGFAPAQYRLANSYENGSGVDRDTDAAMRWYQRAADQGNASAMHNLAVLHASVGSDGGPDYETAAKWFEAAAEHGIRDSQFNLAVLYARGSGVEQDLVQSYKWFAIAAAEGDGDAAAKRDEVAATLTEEELARARAEVELWKPEPLDPEANMVELPEEWGTDDTRTASIDPKQAVTRIQTALNAQGYDAGTPDGIIGARTVEAIKAFQKAEGLGVTGRIDEAFVKALMTATQQG